MPGSRRRRRRRRARPPGAAGVLRPGFDRAAYTDEVVRALKDAGTGLVAMAGFMTVLGPEAFSAFPDRILNTHPSLLPAFPGAHAVRDALAFGVKVTGCTVHVATETVDHGPILAQEAVPVLPGDDEATLHERIKAVERRLYPEIIAEVVGGVSTALLSVYDKGGIVELATGLHELGWRLVSSGGTARRWPTRGCPVTDVADLTGFPAILGHRVVTLHPAVHGGLLADLDQPEHRADLGELGIEPHRPARREPLSVLLEAGHRADRRRRSGHDPGGGQEPRPRRRGHRPGQYEPVLGRAADGGRCRRPPAGAGPGRLRPHRGLRHGHRRLVPVGRRDEPTAPAEGPADHLDLRLERVQELRYGENPHQQAARYRRRRRSWWDDAVQHGGKELSYLNLYDTEAAWRLVQRFDEPAVVIVKHANPCGVALAGDITSAYVAANACDPVSAFGGIVAANRPVPAAGRGARPGVHRGGRGAGVRRRRARGAGRQEEPAGALGAAAVGGRAGRAQHRRGGARAAGRPGRSTGAPGGWSPRSARTTSCGATWPSPGRCAPPSARTPSCSPVTGQAVGIGGGQQNRLDSAGIAATKAAGRADGGCCASDAFFPFRDGLDAVAAAGVRAVIQPGGSVRDDEVDRRRRRARHGHGLHRRTPLPPLVRPRTASASESTSNRWRREATRTAGRGRTDLGGPGPG